MSAPFAFDPHGYGPTVAELLEPARLPELGAGLEVDELRPRLHALKVEDLGGGRPVVDRALGRACLSALWLWFDFLDESHKISQDLPGDTGSFWHGIMHRREGDFWNSKYWFRSVGRHPVLTQIAELAPAVGYAYKDPFAFVDFVERVKGAGTPDEAAAQEVQALEWRLLFDFCHRGAFG